MHARCVHLHGGTTNKTIVLAALASAFFASSAYAHGATAEGPIDSRVEARAGADIARISSEGEGESKTGFDYSVEAGYDFNAAGSIVGMYAGIGDSSTKACAEIFGGDEACIRSGRDITVGGRVGNSISENSLVFLKGGSSFAQQIAPGRTRRDMAKLVRHELACEKTVFDCCDVSAAGVAAEAHAAGFDERRRPLSCCTQLSPSGPSEFFQRLLTAEAFGRCLGWSKQSSPMTLASTVATNSKRRIQAFRQSTDAVQA